MSFVINTGALTRCYLFHPNSSLILISDFVQFVLIDWVDYGEVPTIVLSILYLNFSRKVFSNAEELHISQHSICIPKMYDENVLRG